MNRKTWMGLIVAAASLLASAGAKADLVWTLADGTGYAARAELSLVAPRHLVVRLTNISTGIPPELADSANQLLTSFSLELGDGVEIIGGRATLGPDAYTIGFDNVGEVQLSAGADVSCEWGFGNDGHRIALATSFVSAMTSHTTPFADGNLDGPNGLNGPQAGLVADPAVYPLGGLGAIRGPLILDLYLSGDVSEEELDAETAVVEFGSDAHFLPGGEIVQAPEPMTMTLLGLGGLAMAGTSIRRRWCVAAAARQAGR